MSAPVFKVGDRVRCVREPEGLFGNVWAPVRGKTYEVASIAVAGLVHVRSELEVTLSRGWESSRFELVDEPVSESGEWTPGDGWREARAGDISTGTERVMSWSPERGMRYWVREEPVPPLPTEPWTVIRVQWEVGNGASVLTLQDDGWYGRTATGRYEPRELIGRITGFEVLSRPVVAGGIALAVVQREAAKAVLDYLLTSKRWSAADLDFFAVAARKFGIKS